jgi:hypothetical protein
MQIRLDVLRHGETIRYISWSLAKKVKKMNFNSIHFTSVDTVLPELSVIRWLLRSKRVYLFENISVKNEVTSERHLRDSEAQSLLHEPLLSGLINKISQ